MALQPVIETDSGSGSNMATAQTIGSYSPASNRRLTVMVELSNLNATDTTFTAEVVDANGDVLADYSRPKAESADTTAYLPFINIPVLSTKTLSVRILSSSGNDTNVTWSIGWWDEHRVDVHELAGGQYKIADTTGNWATAGTWEDGVVPAAGDNIIIRDGVTVTVAASLDLGTFGTLEVQGDGALNIASGQTVAAVSRGWVINENDGTITTNYGTVRSNASGGTVETNYGTITNSNGAITTNATGCTVTTNYGTVTTNYGTVTTNSDTVTTNAIGGTVTLNVGTVTTNASGGVVLHNFGTITTDNGDSAVPGDMTKISGDSTAADNLELQYDTTGVTGSTFPATQAQVGAIAATSGGTLNYPAVDDNVDGALKTVAFVGTQTSGTYVSTEAEDGTYHIIDDNTPANALDIVYQFSVGGGRTASEVSFHGYLSGLNDEINIQAYDFVDSDWETRFVLDGTSTDVTETIKLLAKHTGSSGDDIGQVYIRFVCSGQSNPTLRVDSLTVGAVALSQSVGYAGGAVWVDTVNGTAGTESFVNGVADNPVLTYADALTISAAIGLERFHVINGSTVTLSANSANYTYIGHEWTLALNGQTIDNIHVEDADVSGTGVVSAGEAHFVDCVIGTTTVGPAKFVGCDFEGTVTLGVGDYHLTGCSGHGSAVLDFGSAIGSTNVVMSNFHGDVEIQNMGQSGTDTLLFSGDGHITFNANCTGGTAEVYGAVGCTDGGGGVTIDCSETALLTGADGDTGEILSDEIAALVATVGAAGAGLTAIDLPNQTMNITGNLSGSVGSVTGAVGSVTGSVGSVTGDTKQTADHTVAIAAIPTTKTGYKLASDGLDQISAAEVTGKPTTFAGWIMWLIQGFRRSKLTSSTLTVQKEDGTTVTTQAVSDDGTTQTLGPPS